MREKAEKRGWIFAALFVLGLCMAAMLSKSGTTVQAKEQSTEQTGKGTEMRELASRGNLLYQDSGEGAGIFASDFFLLEEKLSSVPEAVFDPAAYGSGSAPRQKTEMSVPEKPEETSETPESEEVAEAPESEEISEMPEESVSENNCMGGES